MGRFGAGSGDTAPIWNWDKNVVCPLYILAKGLSLRSAIKGQNLLSNMLVNTSSTISFSDFLVREVCMEFPVAIGVQVSLSRTVIVNSIMYIVMSHIHLSLYVITASAFGEILSPMVTLLYPSNLNLSAITGASSFPPPSLFFIWITFMLFMLYAGFLSTTALLAHPENKSINIAKATS